ncbi:hypothetical protein EV426DRAFT_673117 [Tirmania nivea]|nr:hypothetical protein EV426DRAFT_673117 [Tirmania nivea]
MGLHFIGTSELHVHSLDRIFSGVTQQRKSKWVTSYSNISASAAQQRLGLKIRNLRSQEIAIERMLAKGTGCGCNHVDEDKGHEHILEHLVAEDYPMEADSEFKEPNVNDLVLHIIVPIINDFTVGYDEFIAISVHEEDKYVLVLESKKSNIGVVMKECMLLALKDMKDSNDDGGGQVYGFITSWKMLSYEGCMFSGDTQNLVSFGDMDQTKSYR